VSAATKQSDQPLGQVRPDPLQQLADLPDWLIAIVQPERVRGALARTIPEFVAGELTLDSCQISRLRLKKGRWNGLYHLTVTRSADNQRIIFQTQGTFTPPDQPEPDQPDGKQALGADGWRYYIAELRLLLEMQKPEAALPSLPILTDPEQSRALLEQSIRAAAPAYHDLRIQLCRPRVVRYKPGSRCTILYDLVYPSDLIHGRSWPELVAVKTYKGGKGANAYAGMRALWESSLGTGEAVTIAEPLGYLPELNALIQGPIREEQTLKDLIRSALRAGTPTALAELDQVMRKTAFGLAALHRSGAQYGEAYTWSEEFAEVRETAEQLGAAVPSLAGVAAPLLDRLKALDAEYPADPLGPAHHSFRPAQVLLYQGKIGFIDFDSFCQAEPALDLALFLSATKNIGLSEPHEEESNEDDTALDPNIRAHLLDQLDSICESFLAEYERHAPISRQRVALWETLDLLELVLTCWTKIKPVRLSNTMAMLERHLSRATGHVAASLATPAKQSQQNHFAEGLPQLAALPTWLLAPLQSERVVEALRCEVPEFSSGALILRRAKIRRMLLKEDAGGRWAGTYHLTIEDPSTGERGLALRGTLTPPHLQADTGMATASVSGVFGTDSWRCVLPELGLDLKPEPPESALGAMPQLTDPEQARVLLERGIRSSNPVYHDMQIQACRPEMISYKPGSRATLRYRLSYAPEASAGRGWPETVIAKTYRKDSKGRNAYDGMVALWHSPLATGDLATIAEPLAYIPELKIMVQRPIPGSQSLEDMLKDALSADSQEAIEELYGYMRKAAVGLAALHQSGVQHGETVGLDERFAEVRDLIARLLVPVPELAGVAEPLLARLESLAGTNPPDPSVPTHGTFNPEQVLIDGQKIGLIDFDDFCMAEPALDVGLFRAAIKDIGMNALDASLAHNREIRLARLAQLDTIGEVFLAEYERHAPISRPRVALWEAWSYLRDALHYWTKVKPAEPDNGVLMLESHLRDMRIDTAGSGGDVARSPRSKASSPLYRYVALASSLVASGWFDDMAEFLEILQSIL